MSQNKKAPEYGVLSTGDSPESKNVLDRITVCENLDQKLIKITEDKMELILIKNLKRMANKKFWMTPLGIFIAILLVCLTTGSFKNFLSIPASVWQAGCYIALIIFGCWTVCSIWQAWRDRKISIASILSEIKNDRG